MTDTGVRLKVEDRRIQKKTIEYSVFYTKFDFEHGKIVAFKMILLKNVIRSVLLGLSDVQSEFYLSVEPC